MDNQAGDLIQKPHLAAPNATVTSPLFGTVTSAPGYPRQIYFALKLLF